MKLLSKQILILLSLLVVSWGATAQTFTWLDPSADVGAAYYPQAIMVDLDNDGYPEMAQAGRDGSLVFVFRTFKNTGTNFNNGVVYPAFAAQIGITTDLQAGDINRDGFIDLFQSHTGAAPELIINPSPGITNLTGTQLDVSGPVSLGDVDGDGDLDILSTSSSGIVITRLKASGYDYSQRLNIGYNNSVGTFWGNLDDDTPLEVIGSQGGGTNQVWNFNGTALVNQGGISYTGQITKGVFGDFDSDGDMDFIGFSTGVPLLFKNSNGTFTTAATGLATGNSIVCGDINNDGKPDIIIGAVAFPATSTNRNVFYLNQGNGTFSELTSANSFGTYGGDGGANCLSDFDGDGDLDFGYEGGMYRNNITPANQAPSVPAGLAETVSGTSAHFAWNASTDDTTPAVSLSYNIHVRRADGTIVVPSHSLSNGKRQIFEIGNAWLNETYDLSCLQQGTYYWKVQAIDASHRGGAFTTERSFTITSVPPVAPQTLTLTAKSDKSIELNWVDQSTTETGFIVFRQKANYIDPTFYAIDTVAANETHFLDNINLEAGTSYVYRVAASNCAYPDELYSEISGETFPRAFVTAPPPWFLPATETRGLMSLLGDFDNDGDLDLLASHEYPLSTKLYRFEGNVFVHVPTVQFPGVGVAGGAQWFDYNTDGFLDLLIFPEAWNDKKIKLFKNVNGTSLVEVTNAGLPPSVLWQAGVSIGDYDLDGDEDLVVQVETSIHVYENNGSGHFTRNTAISLTGNLRREALADFDLDGDLDILASKKVSSTSNTLLVFENLGDKTFGIIEFPLLSGVNDNYADMTGDSEWGDFDNDGYPDILIAGRNTSGGSSGIFKVYRNNGNKTFTQAASLPGLVDTPSTLWGDYDNDGDLDIFAYGDPGSGIPYTLIYRNDGTFVDSGIDYLLVADFMAGDISRGDVDRDGDLDFAVFGFQQYSGNKMYVYRNTLAEDWGLPNHAPSAPTSPTATVDPVTGELTLSWDESTDEETSQDGLTYNLWIKDADGRVVLNSNALSNGTRKVVGAGNASSKNTHTLTRIPAGNYTWAVQALDKGFAGSAFSTEGAFTIPVIPGSEVTGLKDILSVRVFPNPFTHSITIDKGDAQGPLRVDLSTIQGQYLQNWMVDHDGTTLDVSHLPTGMYLLAVTRQDGHKQIMKIVKR